ncbi:MAG: SAM-dependent methyltransferase [Oscillospiraceae bacterium]|nr:SAM-dependent methyltransferase [Oscillospiraceae bacterium]
MKLPISKRLLRCAELVPPCRTAADLGTDHGYLAIHLLQAGRCAHVIAADLREKPLASARANAAAFGICEAAPQAFPLRGSCPSAHTGADEVVPNPGAAASGTISFRLSDGLRNFKPGEFEVLILAGMGGDLIARILAEAPWLDGGDYRLVLQPQSAAHELRRWLGERGWSIERELLVRDGGFLYSVMRVCPFGGRALRPGEQYCSPALRREGDPLFPAYLARMERALALTVEGISRSAAPEDLARGEYYRAALAEILSMERRKQ